MKKWLMINSLTVFFFTFLSDVRYYVYDANLLGIGRYSLLIVFCLIYHVKKFLTLLLT